LQERDPLLANKRARQIYVIFFKFLKTGDF